MKSLRIASIALLCGLSGFAAAAETSPVPVAANPWSMLWGLLFLVALVVGAWWLIRRMGGLPLQANRDLRVIAALSVGPRERVVLVDVGGEQLLLGVAPGRVNMLHRLETPIAVGDGNGGAFAERIRQAMQQVANK